MADILIVEDEQSINELIKKNLTLVGHNCTQLYNGADVEEAILQKQYDLVLLDVMLPGKSGFDLLPLLSEVKIPVILVTARASLEDKIRGLRLGADDYIVKPFAMLELTERVDAVLRRTGRLEEKVSFADITVDLRSRKVLKAGREQPLTPKEFDLLCVLIRNRNLALSRERLLYLVWPGDYEGNDRTVDTHIRRLRQKLGLEQQLKTVSKVGYRLEE